VIDKLIFVLTLFSALGCGLIAGAFFAFSSFVMKALAQLPPPYGIAAMQAINIVVINPLFMAAFLGTGVASLALVVSSFCVGTDRVRLICLPGACSILSALSW
jgi:uncharacterized membrane protein